jgi:hypothetical protein
VAVIHAQESRARLRVDLIVGTAEVWLGEGPAEIVLGSTAVRLIIHDTPGRQGDVSIRWEGAQGINAAGLASLIEWRGEAPENSAEGALTQISYRAPGADAQAEPIQVPLQQLLGHGPVSEALWVAPALVQQAWSGVRTVLAAPWEVVAGAYGDRTAERWQAEQGVRVQQLEAQLTPLRQVLAQLMQAQGSPQDPPEDPQDPPEGPPGGPPEDPPEGPQGNGLAGPGWLAPAAVMQLAQSDELWITRAYGAWDAADVTRGARGQFTQQQLAQLDAQLKGHLVYDPFTGDVGATREDLQAWLDAVQPLGVQYGWLIDQLQVALAASQQAGVLRLGTSVSDSVEALKELVILGLASDQVYTLVSQAPDGALGFGQVAGGTGNDTYVVDDAGDVIVESANQGIDTVEVLAGDYTLGANLENATRTGSSWYNLTGNALDNILRDGGDSWSSLDGKGGNDKLYGGAGQDQLRGGAGNDRLAGGEGKDIYLFGRGDGVDSIIDVEASTSEDVLQFDLAGAARVDFNQLWFSREAAEPGTLKISVMGTSDQVKVLDWYVPNANHRLASIVAANGEGVQSSLVMADVARLVNAMAGMAPPASATSWAGLESSQKSQLQALGVWH